MADLALAFAGFGQTTFNNAEDLILDFINNRSVQAFVAETIPARDTTSGLFQVERVLNDARIKFEMAPLSEICDCLGASDAKEKYLIVLGADDLSSVISDVTEMRIPALDLCEGLDDISWAFGAEISEYKEKPEPVPALDVNKVMAEAMNNSTIMSVEELKEFMTGLIRAHEEGFHNERHHMVPEVKNSESQERSSVAPASEDKIRYYETKTGKIRKAGRSKIKPGETEIWLTKEEADAKEEKK